jgi:hypothetical protein
MKGRGTSREYEYVFDLFFFSLSLEPSVCLTF